MRLLLVWNMCLVPCLGPMLVWDVCLSGMYACLEGRGWLLVDKTKIEPLSGTGGGELVRQAASTISHCLVPGLGMFCLPGKMDWT